MTIFNLQQVTKHIQTPNEKCTVGTGLKRKGNGTSSAEGELK